MVYFLLEDTSAPQINVLLLRQSHIYHLEEKLLMVIYLSNNLW